MYRFQCNDCKQLLYLDPNVLSKNNRRIPLNQANQQPHKCPARRFAIPCMGCKEMIYFDYQRLSKNNKKIPLNNSDGLPHDCLGMEFGAKAMVG